jgi:A/G-specific adenine glycosylase
MASRKAVGAKGEVVGTEVLEAPEAGVNLGFSVAEFRRRLGVWYRQHARDLPWRGVTDPYATWLSEIMLQQTRVATVIDRYGEFLLRFPTIKALAEAEEREVLALWSGLGYYRRARMLHRGAQFVMRELKGRLPKTATALRTLPGVGPYTAAAIASIAFGERIAVIDGNVERVLLRVLGKVEEKTSKASAELAQVAQALMPLRSRGASPADHNQAMMELGATICTPRSPLCLECPVVAMCATKGAHATLPREKQRSRTVAHLLALRKRGVTTEVLLERRDKDASLMAGMLELPPLPLDVVAGREPVLRLRHAITNTNYYVEVYSEGAPGVAPAEGDRFENDEDAAVFEMNSGKETIVETPLRDAIPAKAKDLEWVSTGQLPQQPLTGLARKVLQRLRVMRIATVQLDWLE